jgi:hypothetical protein
MNDRIKELSIQADEWMAETSNWRHIKGLPGLIRDQKFAELIVRECAEIAKHHIMNISTYADAEFVDEQIKEHFGVE